MTKNTPKRKGEKKGKKKKEKKIIVFCVYPHNSKDSKLWAGGENIK